MYTFYIEGSNGETYSSENLSDWEPSLHSFSSGLGILFIL